MYYGKRYTFSWSPVKRTINEEQIKNMNKGEIVMLKSWKHNECINQKKLHQLPTVNPGTKGWNSIKFLNDTITTLKKSITTSTNKTDQDNVFDNIQKYEKRCNKLQEQQYVEDRNDNEEMEDDEEEEKIPLWEDVVYINNEIKKYEVRAHQKRNETQTERQPILTMISMLQKRLVISS